MAEAGLCREGTGGQASGGEGLGEGGQGRASEQRFGAGRKRQKWQAGGSRSSEGLHRKAGGASALHPQKGEPGSLSQSCLCTAHPDVFHTHVP